MKSIEANIRQLGAADAEAFSALRRKVVVDNPVPMGLSYDEELTRPIEGFRNQLSFPAPNVAFGAFVHGELIGSAAIAWPSKWPSSMHKAELWGIFVSPSFRGRGIGRQLVSKTLDHARNNDVRRVNCLSTYRTRQQSPCTSRSDLHTVASNRKLSDWTTKVLWDTI